MLHSASVPISRYQLITRTLLRKCLFNQPSQSPAIKLFRQFSIRHGQLFKSKSNPKIINELKRQIAQSSNRIGSAIKAHGIDSMAVFCLGLTLAYFFAHTLLMNNFVELAMSEDMDPEARRKLTATSKQLLSLVYDVMKASHIDDAYKQIDPSIIYSSNNLQPLIFGSYLSRFGVCFIFPFYFNIDPKEDLDMKLICRLLKLDYERLAQDADPNTGISMLQELKQALMLSEKAKQFLTLSLFHQASMPVLYFNSFSILLFPYIFFRAGVKALGPPGALCGAIVGLMALYQIIGHLKRIQQRFGYWAICKKELDDQTVRHDLFSGAEEYFDKLSQLDTIMKSYSKLEDQNLFRKRLVDFVSLFSSDYRIEYQMRDWKRFKDNSNQLSWFDPIID